MSFGLDINDFSTALQLARSIVDACQKGPGDYRDICKDVDSFRKALEWTTDDATTLPPLTEKLAKERKAELEQVISDCEGDLRHIQQLIDQYSRLTDYHNVNVGGIGSHRVWDSDYVGSEDLEDIRQRLVSHTSTIDLFVDSLQTAVVDQIFHCIDRHWATERQHYHQTVDEPDYVLSVSASHRAGVLIENVCRDADNSAWNDLQDLLNRDGIPNEDVEFNKTKIIHQVKAVVEKSVAEDTTVAAVYQAINDADMDSLSQRLSQVQTTLSSTRSQNFELYTQQFGKSSFNFRISSVQHGTYRSHPACLFLVDIWLESCPGYAISSGEMTIITNFKNLSNPQIAPSILALSPQSAEGGDGTTDAVDFQPTQAVVDTGSDDRGNPDANGHASSNPDWILSGKRIAVRPAANLNSVRWSVQAAPGSRQRPLHQKHRLALVIEHHGADFALSITRNATLKSLVSRLKTSHKRKPQTVRLSFGPEVSESVLDDLDLDVLTSLKRRDGRADSGFYRTE